MQWGWLVTRLGLCGFGNPSLLSRPRKDLSQPLSFPMRATSRLHWAHLSINLGKTNFRACYRSRVMRHLSWPTTQSQWSLYRRQSWESIPCHHCYLLGRSHCYKYCCSGHHCQSYCIKMWCCYCWNSRWYYSESWCSNLTSKALCSKKLSQTDFRSRL